MTSFAQVVTIAGRAADAASRLSGAPGLNIAGGTIVFGDGGGADVNPVETQTALVNQLASMPVSSVYQDTSDPTIFWVACTYGDQPGLPALRGYTIRECGIMLPGGTLFSVGSFPDMFLPLPSGGAALSLNLRIPIVETTAGANIVINENASLYATEIWVDTQMGVIGGDLLAAIANNAAQLSQERVLRRAESLRASRVERQVAWMRSQLGI